MKLFEIVIAIYIIGFNIYSCVQEISPWVFFICEVFVCVSLCLLTYNQLDNIFPPILYDDKDYKSMRVSKTDNFFFYFFSVIFYILVVLILFLSVMYIINFSIQSGIYYLMLSQSLMYMCTIFYFLSESFNDYSGHAYCEYYKLRNFVNSENKIKQHFLPRTLTREMYENYENEFFL